VEKQQQKQKKKDKDSKQQPPLNAYARYGGMGFQMLAIILIFYWVGQKLDKHTTSEFPAFTAILSFLGVVAALYVTLKDFIRKEDE